MVGDTLYGLNGNDNFDYKTYSLVSKWIITNDCAFKGHETCLTEIQKDGSEKVIRNSEEIGEE